MCGGRIEVLPCSRIGHIFKSVSHKFPSGHSVLRNLNRVVEVRLSAQVLFSSLRVLSDCAACFNFFLLLAAHCSIAGVDAGV